MNPHSIIIHSSHLKPSILLFGLSFQLNHKTQRQQNFPGGQCQWWSVVHGTHMGVEQYIIMSDLSTLVFHQYFHSHNESTLSNKRSFCILSLSKKLYQAKQLFLKLCKNSIWKTYFLLLLSENKSLICNVYFSDYVLLIK